MTALPTSVRIVFIGAGNMAEALVSGLVKTGVCRPTQITVTDVRPERMGALRSAYGVSASDDNRAAVREAGVIVLAVKPQVLPGVLAELTPARPAESLVISIAAGIPTSVIEKGLGGNPAVIRVMPNTPALIGAGASGISAGRHATPAHLDLAERLFQAVGVVARVAEADMDAVTALSGSGPAYVFYFIEAMLEAARRMGLDEATARRLAFATVEGSARLGRDSAEAPADLRERVTSKGGTTAAALEVLKQRGVFDSLIDAMQAAARRSRELSGGG